MDRRNFLKATGTLAAASMLPQVPGALLTPADAARLRRRAARLTTLGRTIVQGTKLKEGTNGAYYRLAAGPGEPYLVRDELAPDDPDNFSAARAGQRSLLSFVHLTDFQLVDAQSPARVEFLDRFSDPRFGCETIPFDSAHQPQETAILHIIEAMIRQVRRLRVSPATGAPIRFAICTGDNTDNEQFNEVRWFVDVMDGRKTVAANSGGKDYEGVQSSAWADPEYWHPDPKIDDKYKQQWGFPDYPGFLQDAVKPFRAAGIGMPWFQVFGNHDGLMQGNAPENPIFEAVAVGGTKVVTPPPGLNPCDAFETLQTNPAALLSPPTHDVTPDERRRIVTRAEYVAEMFKTTGRPKGHGFTSRNKQDGTAYWHSDAYRHFRLIGLDTVNPGGYDDGSIGATQFAWLEERLVEASSVHFDADGNEVKTKNEDRYIILFSHHGLRSLENPNMAPNPFDPASNDLPRMLAEEIETLLHRFPNVIAWVNGHSHDNIVEPKAGTHGGFWDIGTAGHRDWPCQSRVIEVVDNNDGTLSIFSTIVDHDGPLVPGGRDPVLRVASIARELAANDYQKGFGSGAGEEQDRNVELRIRAPFRVPRRGRPDRQSPRILVPS